MKIKDIIYREDAIKALHEEWDGGWMEVTGEWVADNCEAVLNRLPSADRPQGEWIEHKWAEEVEGLLISNYECSECHSWERRASDFCPNCGTRMKGAYGEAN